LDAAIDFPLWQTSRDVFTGAKPVSALRDVLRYDGLYADAHRLMTMVTNHDAPRFRALERATPAGARLHMAFTLSVRGTPQLYYGDEIGLAGGRDHASNRADFPGGFAGDRHNAFERAGRDVEQQSMYQWTRDWLRMRRDHVALRRGNHIDLAWDEDTYLFARLHDDELVLIAINRSASPREITAPAAWLGRGVAELRPLLGDAQAQIMGDVIVVAAPPASITPFEVKFAR
jgi:neopullulanase